MSAHDPMRMQQSGDLSGPFSATARMSAFGTKQTSKYDRLMSAFGGKADIPSASQNVR
jgi:hypothetical protein